MARGESPAGRSGAMGASFFSRCGQKSPQSWTGKFRCRVFTLSIRRGSRVATGSSPGWFASFVKRWGRAKVRCLISVLKMGTKLRLRLLAGRLGDSEPRKPAYAGAPENKKYRDFHYDPMDAYRIKFELEEDQKCKTDRSLRKRCIFS